MINRLTRDKLSTLINKHKTIYKSLKDIDIRKVSRAIVFISNQGKVYGSSVANFVDGNDYYSIRSNERYFLAHDVLTDLNLIKDEE